MEFSAFETGTNVSVTTAATPVLASSGGKYRNYSLQNQGAVTVWLGFGADPTAADGGGFIRLVAGATYNTSTKGTVAAIVASGTANLCVSGAG